MDVSDKIHESPGVSSVGGVAAEATVARQHNTGGTRTGYHGPWSLAAGERELSSDTGH